MSVLENVRSNNKIHIQYEGRNSISSKLVSRYRIYKPHVEIICFLCLNIKEQFDA